MIRIFKKWRDTKKAKREADEVRVKNTMLASVRISEKRLKNQVDEMNEKHCSFRPAKDFKCDSCVHFYKGQSTKLTNDGMNIDFYHHSPYCKLWIR